jgi:peptidyl-prolyl cis-trans isomerase B (cyclophilin B)
MLKGRGVSVSDMPTIMIACCFLISLNMKRFFPLAILLVFCACTAEKTYQVGQINTSFGEMLIWLYDETPEHKEAFIELAEEGYYDDYTFNRVINDFVAQGGCPDVPEGFAYSVHLLEPEFRDNIQHIYGAFGAGRDGNPGKLSAACQFYIVQNENGLARLDGDYMIYGHVFKGMDLVDKIVKVETDSTNQPLTPIELDVNVIQMTAAAIEAYGFEIPVGSK